MRSLRCILFGIVVSLLATACVPTTFTRTRMAWKPYAEGDSKQEKEGVIAELKFAKQVPESFFATVQACGRAGQLLVDRGGNAVVERVSFARPGQFWELLALTNQTDHVIRMNQVAIRVFDPGGSQVDTKEDTPQPEGPSPQRPEGPGPQLTTTPPASQSSSPARSLSPTKDTISRVQIELKARGFDPGPPDGSIGQKTQEALRKFQNAHRLRGTGEIDTATLEALGIR